MSTGVVQLGKCSTLALPGRAVPEIQTNNGRLVLDLDGRLWTERRPAGARVWVPVEPDEVRAILTGRTEELELEPTVLQVPPAERRVPPEILAGWAKRLVQASAVLGDTEALAIYGQNLSTGQWVALVPKQEVTMGSVDTDGLARAEERMAQHGAITLGTIHTPRARPAIRIHYRHLGPFQEGWRGTLYPQL